MGQLIGAAAVCCPKEDLVGVASELIAGLPAGMVVVGLPLGLHMFDLVGELVVGEKNQLELPGSHQWC